jgi:hypothetical protein
LPKDLKKFFPGKTFIRRSLQTHDLTEAIIRLQEVKDHWEKTFAALRSPDEGLTPDQILAKVEDLLHLWGVKRGEWAASSAKNNPMPPCPPMLRMQPASAKF